MAHNHRRPQRPEQPRQPLLGCATSQGRIATYLLQEGKEEEEEEEEASSGPLLVPGPVSRPLGDEGECGAYMSLALVSGRACISGDWQSVARPVR
jgi:hypothetical protein